MKPAKPSSALTLAFTHDVAQSLASGIGEGGVPDAAYAEALGAAREARERLRREARAGSLSLLAVPGAKADLPAIKKAARRLRKGARDIVVLGTGGSSLGGQALAQLADHGVPGLEAKPRAHFLGNLDPVSLERFLKRLKLKHARFLAVSKSGGTGETLMQSMAVLSALEAAGHGGEAGDLFTGLSEPAVEGRPNALRALLEPLGVPFLDHDTGVGGRYSVLTNTGLLPAAMLGLDVKAVRRGAAEVLAATLTQEEPAAVQGAALNLAAMASGKGVAVMMAYADRLERFTAWFVQLWAESLGKPRGHDRLGSQPVAALGPVDQHSQQQLYLAGPRDKLFTVITVETKGLGPAMDADLAERAGEPGFAGRTVGDLVAAQGRAMVRTFAANGCPVRLIHLPVLDERAMGALLMHFMLETVLTGYALGIDPFDQPAVEEAKLLAKRLLAEG